MASRIRRISILVAVGGAVVFGGCLGGGGWKHVATDAAMYTGLEFLTDNDAVFDLFPDDFGTGSQYDDRFSAPSRAEPTGFNANNLGTGPV
jgi:hypothetical protein